MDCYWSDTAKTLVHQGVLILPGRVAWSSKKFVFIAKKVKLEIPWDLLKSVSPMKQQGHTVAFVRSLLKVTCFSLCLFWIRHFLIKESNATGII